MNSKDLEINEERTFELESFGGDDSRAEIIGEAGILTDPPDIDQYSKDLELAANTDFKNKPYIQSLMFSWNKIAEKYSVLIGELLSRK